MGSEDGVYAISIAAELSDTAIQNLRVYERHGLVRPSRTSGGTRLYSPADIDRLLEIRVLLARGLNLAGIAIVLDLRRDLVRLRDENQVLQRQLDDAPVPHS